MKLLLHPREVATYHVFFFVCLKCTSIKESACGNIVEICWCSVLQNKQNKSQWRTNTMEYDLK